MHLFRTENIEVEIYSILPRNSLWSFLRRIIQFLRLFFASELTNHKWEYNRENDCLFLDRILKYPYFYPFAYGFAKNAGRVAKA